MTAILSAKLKAEEWFSLDCYEAAENFSPLVWSKQIIKRVAILECFKQGNVSDLNQLMEELIDAPLAYADKAPYRNTSQALAELPYARGSVVPFAFHDLDRIRQLREDFPENADSSIDEWARGNEELLAQTSFGHIKVDLNARDSEIRKDFAQWLKAYRVAVGMPARESYRNDYAQDMQNWYASKLLPYFDLTAWKKWSVAELTEDDIVALLYPSSDFTRDKLRSLETKVTTVFTLATAVALSIA